MDYKGDGSDEQDRSEDKTIENLVEDDTKKLESGDDGHYTLTANASEGVAPDSTTPPTELEAKIIKPTKNHLNKYFLYTLVVGLIIAAVISITAVLVGEFNSTMVRSLSTTASMVFHTLVLLVLISLGGKNTSKSTNFLTNVLLVITVASFITSILGIWEVITGRIVGDLYLLYFYSFFISIWAKLLLKVGENRQDKATRITSSVALGLTGLFYILLIPTIFTHYPDKLPEFYYRGMAATIIALSTASVLTTVFRRIFLFKHPDQKSPKDKAWDIIIAVITALVGLPIIFGLITFLAAYNSYESYSSDTYKNTYTENTTAEPSVSPTIKPLSDGSINCAQTVDFASSDIFMYPSTHKFVSHDASQKQLVVIWEGNSINQELNYLDDLIAVDKDCKKIAISRFDQNDNVRFYLHINYTALYKDAVAVIQKLD